MEELQRQLLEAQLQRQKAEERALAEQRQREEAENRASAEQRQREDERRLRENAENRALAEQRLREEEQRLRAEAEERATSSSPLTLNQYLDACHSVDLAMKIVTDRSLTTQGETTNPAGRICPRRIIPWDAFPIKQEEIWGKLSIASPFSSQLLFPSQHQLDYVQSLIRPISSEQGLRDYQHDVVENAVQKLVDQAYMDPAQRASLGLEGTVTFESHTNLGPAQDDTISKPLEGMSLGEEDLEQPTTASGPIPKPRRSARGKGNRADQFCIYRNADGIRSPVLAIEYKAPHKLSMDEVVTGLKAEIQPERDVINQDGQGFDFHSKALVAAVVTQLFSYMIGKGIQYGYVCTAKTIIFTHIPEDPSFVYVHVCVPHLDVMEDDDTRLHRTAVAQVFAFVLRALCASPPPQSWHAKAEELSTWAVEYDDILSKIPATVRKGREPRASPYKPQRWKGFARSPIRTRSRCRPNTTVVQSEDDEEPPSPTPNPSLGGRRGRQTTARTRAPRGRGRQGPEGQQQGQGTKPKIQDRPFCTQACLLGLAHGGILDASCPNYAYHAQKHISQLHFLHLVRKQLATDRERDADCAPLHRSGYRGSLFKVRLSSHGYTLVAKGMEGLDHIHLQHEAQVYRQLHGIQGQYVPVCLGLIDLMEPQYYDSGVFVHFLFLSWAGRPLLDYLDQVDREEVADAVTSAFRAIHRLGVLHLDAKPRNMLYDGGNLMVIDFERAEIRGRQPLGSIGSNGHNRRKKRAAQKAWARDSSRELQCARESAVDVIGDNITMKEAVLQD